MLKGLDEKKKGLEGGNCFLGQRRKKIERRALHCRGESRRGFVPMPTVNADDPWAFFYVREGKRKSRGIGDVKYSRHVPSAWTKGVNVNKEKTKKSAPSGLCLKFPPFPRLQHVALSRYSKRHAEFWYRAFSATKNNYVTWVPTSENPIANHLISRTRRDPASPRPIDQRKVHTLQLFILRRSKTTRN